MTRVLIFSRSGHAVIITTTSGVDAPVIVVGQQGHRVLKWVPETEHPLLVHTLLWRRLSAGLLWPGTLFVGGVGSLRRVFLVREHSAH